MCGWTGAGVRKALNTTRVLARLGGSRRGVTAGIAHIPLIRELTMQVWPQTYIPIVGEEQVNYMLNRFYTPEALAQQMTREKAGIASEKARQAVQRQQGLR